MGLFSSSAEELNKKGWEYFQRNQLDSAIKQYTKALKLAPNVASIHYNLGLALDRGGRREEALKEYLEALRLNPDLADAHYFVGYYFLTKGSLDNAMPEFKKVIELNTGDMIADAYINMSACYIHLGQYDDAIRECREGIRHDPARYELHDSLGIAFYYKSMYKEAIVEYQNALRLKPGDLKIQNNIRMAEECLRIKRSSPQQNDLGHVIIQKEIVREIVKVPCQYCDTLADITASKCPGCGAPFSIHQ